MIDIDISHVTLLVVIIGLVVRDIFERNHSLKQEQSLIKALLSGTSMEYKEALRTPEQSIAEARAESALATKAYELQKLDSPETTGGKPGERSFNVGA